MYGMNNIKYYFVLRFVIFCFNFMCVCSFCCRVHPLVAYYIDTRAAVSHNKVLLVSSIYATCFGRANHLHAVKYMTLKPKIKCIYIGLIKICEISPIVQAVTIFMQHQNINILYIFLVCGSLMYVLLLCLKVVKFLIYFECFVASCTCGQS